MLQLVITLSCDLLYGLYNAVWAVVKRMWRMKLLPVALSLMEKQKPQLLILSQALQVTLNPVTYCQVTLCNGS